MQLIKYINMEMMHKVDLGNAKIGKLESCWVLGYVKKNENNN